LLFGDSGGGQPGYPYGPHQPASTLFGGFSSAPHQTPYNIFGTYLTDPTTTTTAPTNPYNVDPQDFVNRMLAPLQAQLAGQSAQDNASAHAAIRRALIQGGYEFDAKKDIRRGLGYAIPHVMDAKTIQAIKEANDAGLTQKFTIDRANEDAKRQIINTLAARGILRSGATGFQLGRQNTAYTQANYGSRQKILDTIAGIWGGFLQAERQRAAMMAQAGMSAAQSAG